MTATGRHQQAKLVQHPFYRALLDVIPADDPLGCVPPALECDFQISSEEMPALSGNLDEQSVIRDSDIERMTRGGDPVQHTQAFIEGRACKLLMRELAWNDTQNLVDVCTCCFDHGQVCNSRRI